MLNDPLPAPAANGVGDRPSRMKEIPATCHARGLNRRSITTATGKRWDTCGWIAHAIASATIEDGSKALAGFFFGRRERRPNTWMRLFRSSICQVPFDTMLY